MKKPASGVLLAAGLFLGACGPAGDRAEGPGDTLFLQTSSGIATFETGAGSPTYSGTGAVASSGWSTIVQATLVQSIGREASTRIEAVDPLTGKILWERTVAGRLRVKVVSEDGNLVVLAPRNERHHLFGRRDTTWVIVDARKRGARTIEISRNVEPEAFSTDGRSLFVLLYTPSRAPTNYQVRRLDLATEGLMEVFTPDAHLQKSMRGTARIQAMSPDGTRLYTLYTVGRGRRAHAFIHTLDLEQLWAHCTDLPHKFARANEWSTDITVSADGERAYIVDSALRAVAEMDTEALEVTRTARVDFGGGSSTHAITGPRDALYVSSGRHLTAVDPETLVEGRSWSMEQRITGVQTGAGGTRLYVGLRNRVEILDPVTGRAMASLDPPGVQRIALLGTGARRMDDYQSLTCAC
ncbi:MAG: YncE family protein [Actinomycetota bacterium]